MWNGEVTGIRGKKKKSGGFEGLTVNSPDQWRERGEGVFHGGGGGVEVGGRAGGGRNGDVEILWEKKG